MKHEAILALPGGDWTIIIEDDELISCHHGVSPQGLPAAPGNHPILCALRAYADGDLPALDEIPVTQPGGEFHTAVREAMRRIPPGRTVSYSELAAMAGRPAAARAAAGACARNRVAVVVRGTLERNEGVTNLVADRVEGIDVVVPGAGAVLQARASSRDFR